MKVMTILGTRPEIIRLSLIMKQLDHSSNKHIIVHTGQNFTSTLNDVFFDQLRLRKPDYILFDKQQSLGEQLSRMFLELEKILLKEKPDKVLVLGDTNSALGAILAERMGIPVVHMEAGNRCFDWRVPEEKNRRIVDAVSSFNLPYTPNSKEHLLQEGIANNRIMLSGNPIYEVLEHYKKEINESGILKKINLKPHDYFLVTIHRAENVDEMKNLIEITNGLNAVAETFNKRVVCSLHPRTKSRMKQMNDVELHPLIEFYEPFGFFDFVKLEQFSYCVLTDSGTVQEECCIFHVPTVTVRTTTERPETIDCGSNMLSGINKSNILDSVKVMTNHSKTWVCPDGYTDTNVSDKVVKFILGGANFVL
ncbi:non-hydrolyzing UDP-N-acetylglucosamine 2-epimerase [Alteribacillus bidgolensis]|uniref:UDP-N-acetylglucosamine 2-epimerase (Non-hydrolysing) n=1 Tax=Alteribacillus bidgolensis TaxID=930129 RepID=A0A1G8I2R2_9BACI|nr:UDP-N-acetylglucosamine 2-epimerase (non-hydrolyzing) [Alteribacillus bidgolensis]SDI13246.1 UDP-N-acetylglucosamine 2-epimerase (non-hydrolysing) [Alteribacillus bidgolensis]